MDRGGSARSRNFRAFGCATTRHASVIDPSSPGTRVSLALRGVYPESFGFRVYPSSGRRQGSMILRLPLALKASLQYVGSVAE